MTKKLVWRLKEQPTSKTLQELVSSKILTNEEAREILFSSEEKKDRDVKSLQSEIKFLRELVEKLSNKNNTRIVETIREVEKICPTYPRYPWYQPYVTWYSTGDYTSGTLEISTMTNFSDIKTF